MGTPANDLAPVVEAIVVDLRDRTGLGSAWDSIDAAMQDEIRREWVRLIAAELIELADVR